VPALRLEFLDSTIRFPESGLLIVGKFASEGELTSWIGRVDVGVVPERLRGSCESNVVVTSGTGNGVLRNWAAETDGRNRRSAKDKG